MAEHGQVLVSVRTRQAWQSVFVAYAVYVSTLQLQEPKEYSQSPAKH
jgi:hypothetical protein